MSGVMTWYTNREGRRGCAHSIVCVKLEWGIPRANLMFILPVRRLPSCFNRQQQNNPAMLFNVCVNVYYSNDVTWPCFWPVMIFSGISPSPSELILSPKAWPAIPADSETTTSGCEKKRRFLPPMTSLLWNPYHSSSDRETFLPWDGRRQFKLHWFPMMLPRFHDYWDLVFPSNWRGSLSDRQPGIVMLCQPKHYCRSVYLSGYGEATFDMYLFRPW